jgi:hypothetical protein
MVLYNSPLAVALLIATLLGVGIALLPRQAQLAHATHALPDARLAAALRRQVFGVAAAILLVYALWISLLLLAFRQAFDPPEPLYFPDHEISWSPATETGPAVVTLDLPPD